ncbi:MAG: pyrroline-5-carboxylate reductase [Ruminococcaceae bacterium]|nr:pyrroline-5-carboxylate reductase [Oscillospiraceae bacterium]
MDKTLAVIGVGNMAGAIISGIQSSDIGISEIFLYDKLTDKYSSLPRGNCKYIPCDSIWDAIDRADYVLLSVKPQNFNEVLSEISQHPRHSKKVYITIAAGITVQTVSSAVSTDSVVRVLPNIPMTIGSGVSLVCRNDNVGADVFSFVCQMFSACGSTVVIEEEHMNRMIGVTSSSPAYVFKFIDCIYKGAIAQGLPTEGLIDAICDVFIGSAMLLKQSGETADSLISKVASKGGTTQKALDSMDSANITNIIVDAMVACTNRADELGRAEK